MKQIKNRFLIASVAATLAAMLATASILTGCGSNDEETDETKVITETQLVTKIVNGVFTDEEGNIIRDKDGQPITAPSGTPDTDEKEKNENKSDNGKTSDSKSSDYKSSDNKSSGSKSSDSKSSGSKSSDNKSSDSKSDGDSSKDDHDDDDNGDVLKVGGKSFSVGDTIICTYSVTCPNAFINYQATLNYDNSKLKATGAKMQGDASTGGVVNYKLDSKVKFNGINLNGYDFSDGGKFMYVTYEVVDTGSTSPEINWEIVTDDNDKPMVVNGDLQSSFKVSESWEKD